jgi:hypothetical protein
LKPLHGVLAVTLVAASLAAWWLQPSAPDPVEVVGRERSSATARSSANVATGSSQLSTVLSVRPRDRVDKDPAHLFGETSWVQATPPLPAAVAVPAPPPPPAIPAAPPLPFRLLGRYSDGATPAVFLQFNDQNLVVRVGDKVADSYQVESLDDNSLTLLHLPTQQRQTLNLGAAK